MLIVLAVAVTLFMAFWLTQIVLPTIAERGLEPHDVLPVLCVALTVFLWIVALEAVR